MMTAVEAEQEAVIGGIGNTLNIDVAVAGVGPAKAAARTAFVLGKTEYDLVMSAGIAGGFKKRAGIGDIVISERLIAAELGADAQKGFIPIDELGFGSNVIHADHQTVDRLSARLVEANQVVRTGSILTLSTVTGSEEKAAALMQRFPYAQAEAMEGFGVATAAKEKNLPVLEIRAISNEIGPRDKGKWEIKEALAQLEKASASIAEVLE